MFCLPNVVLEGDFSGRLGFPPTPPFQWKPSNATKPRQCPSNTVHCNTRVCNTMLHYIHTLQCHIEYSSVFSMFNIKCSMLNVQWLMFNVDVEWCDTSVTLFNVSALTAFPNLLCLKLFAFSHLILHFHRHRHRHHHHHHHHHHHSVYCLLCNSAEHSTTRPFDHASLIISASHQEKLFLVKLLFPAMHTSAHRTLWESWLQMTPVHGSRNDF